MDNRPIGVFDSGLGGLTAVANLRKLLPKENIIYFGDTGRVPYGTKSVETLKKYAAQDISFLKEKKVKFILAACGTVSSVADEVGKNCGITYTGVLTPTVAAAVKATKNNRIGVIGTPATIKSGAYEKLIKETLSDAQIFSNACPLFVPFVENGHTSKDDVMVQAALKEYLYTLRRENIDTLILGCTHYPLLGDAISDYMGENVKLINSGREAAIYCAEILKEKDMLAQREHSLCEYYVSDSTESFYENAKCILGDKIKGNVHFVDISAYGV